jgi:F-type H+-transporting ATPase subunit epsilon
MKVEIISPEGTFFSGKISMLTLPGLLGSFTILPGHAPIISALNKGKLNYRQPDTGDKEFLIAGGFIEMKHNVISVCIDGFVNEQ